MAATLVAVGSRYLKQSALPVQGHLTLRSENLWCSLVPTAKIPHYATVSRLNCDVNTAAVAVANVAMVFLIKKAAMSWLEVTGDHL